MKCQHEKDGRRIVLLAVALVALAARPLATPLAAEARHPEQVPRVGFVGFHSPGLESRIIAYFQERLAELGYVKGRNISILYRWADGQVARYQAIAAELVRSQVDLIVTPCGPSLRAIRKLHARIPLVIRSNDVKSCGTEIAALDRPGGDTTGAIYFAPEATARRLELLKELIPKLAYVGVLYQPASDWMAHWAEVEAAAQKTGLRLHRAEWEGPSDLRVTFDNAIAQRVGALLTLGDGPTWFYRHEISELAANRRLPVLYDFSMFPAAEVGLMSYSIDTRALFRHVAEQVDQILRGSKPGDIPIGRPQQFRLFINHDAARALGLTVPQSLRLREQVVE
jgi:putative ABC transport system substrate-binding protein